MKKMIVFGATGGTGRLVVEQSLQAGYQVTVMVRNPGSLTVSHKNLQITRGDVLQPGTVDKAMEGNELVVSCLGIQKREPTTVYSEGVRNIIRVMQKENIRRLICISAGAVIVPPDSNFMTKFFTKNILQRLFKFTYADMLRMEDLLKQTDIDWTVIRPPWLRNGRHTGEYRIAVNQHIKNPSKISRADLADYIVHHLSDERTFRATVELSY